MSRYGGCPADALVSCYLHQCAGTPGRMDLTFLSLLFLLANASVLQIACLVVYPLLAIRIRALVLVELGTGVPVHLGATLQSISIGNATCCRLLWLVVSSLEATGACYLVSVSTDNFFIMLDFIIKH